MLRGVKMYCWYYLLLWIMEGFWNGDEEGVGWRHGFGMEVYGMSCIGYNPCSTKRWSGKIDRIAVGSDVG